MRIFKKMQSIAIIKIERGGDTTAQAIVVHFGDNIQSLRAMGIRHIVVVEPFY